MQDNVIENFLTLIQPVTEHIAEIYLFGSRCGDNWRPDSDYDIMIVLAKKDRVIIDRLYEAVMDVLLSTTKLISLKIFTSSEFNRLKSIPTPFMSNVMSKGIKIGIHG